MSAPRYFSERERGASDPASDSLGEEFWKGLLAAIQRRIADGCFAEAFPKQCFESPYPVETDVDALGGAFAGENPSVPWPLRANCLADTLPALDAVEFFAKHVSQVSARVPHPFGRHDHFLAFDKEAGQRTFRDEVNILFIRNGHPYQLRDDGRIARIGMPVLGETLAAERFSTVDAVLNGLLADAVAKFLSADAATRRDGLEKLWDAWERIKTVLDPAKNLGTNRLITAAVQEPNLRAVAQAEAQTLTDIGNRFHIRHFETDRIEIGPPEHVEYLFHRLFALVKLSLGAVMRL